MPKETWFDQANCKGLKVDIFHPSADADAIEHAKSFCRGCQVRRECLEYAHDNEGAGDANLDGEIGIYGGLTYKERRLYWRSRRPSNLRKAQSA